MDNTNSPLSTQSPDRFLCCDTDSVLVCGKGIDNVKHPIRTDANSVLATLPSASVQSQIGRLFSIVTQSLQVLGQFSLDFSGKIIIPPGHNLGIQTFAGSLSEGSVNMRETVIWYELDVPAKPK